jgi:hypothetical protein
MLGLETPSVFWLSGTGKGFDPTSLGVSEIAASRFVAINYHHRRTRSCHQLGLQSKTTQLLVRRNGHRVHGTLRLQFPLLAAALNFLLQVMPVNQVLFWTGFGMFTCCYPLPLCDDGTNASDSSP